MRPASSVSGEIVQRWWISLPSLRRLVIRPRQEWCPRKGGFDGGPEPRLVLAAPQELGRRAAERLFGRVAGEAREGGVHVDEPEAPGLGDLHQIVDLLDRGRHQAEPLMGFSPGSDVARRHGWAGLMTLVRPATIAGAAL